MSLILKRPIPFQARPITLKYTTDCLSKYMEIFTRKILRFKSSDTRFSVTVPSKIESRLIRNVMISRCLALDAGSALLEKMFFYETRK